MTTHNLRDPGLVPELVPKAKPFPCRLAQPDRRPSTRPWTLDLCALVVFGGVKRPREHDWPVGRQWQMLSVNPIRAQQVSLDTGVEPCRHHYARPTKCPDGRWRILFCTRSGDNVERFALGNVYTERGETNGMARRGRAAAWAYAHTPFWTEARYDSSPTVCGIIV